MLANIKAYIADLLEREAARLIAWTTATTTAAIFWVATAVGVTLSPELVLALAGLAGFIATEVIRHFVWSLRSVKALQKD